MDKLGLSIFLCTIVCVHSSYIKKYLKPSTAVLQCSEGEVTGLEEFTDHVKEIMAGCDHHMPEMHLYYNCILKTVGSFNEDGRPTIESIQNFYDNLFSEPFFEKIPGLKSGLIKCAETYVSEYYVLTETEAQMSDLSQEFVVCFLDETDKFTDQGDRVCEMEDDTL